LFNSGGYYTCRDFFDCPGNILVVGREINMSLIIMGIVLIISGSIGLALKIQEIRNRDA
jgi:ABC-type nickel/cobalt efflux system permease component RcnA